jgi:YesN/AraC family two-component response regulator
MNNIYKILIPTLFFISIHLYSQVSEKDRIKNHLKIRPIQNAEAINPDSALVLAQKLLPSLKNDPRTRSNLYIEMAQCYTLLGKKEQAFSNTLKAKEAALLTNNEELKARSTLLLAYQYGENNILTKAKKEIKEGLIYLKSMPEDTKLSTKSTIQSAFLWQYGVFMRQESKLDSSVFYFHKALLPLSKASKSDEWVRMYYNIAYTDLATSYFQKKNPDSSEYYSLKAIEIAKTTPLNKDEILKNAKLNLALVYHQRKQYQRAIDTLKSAERVIKGNEAPLKAQLYSYLAQNYKATDNLKNYQKYNDLYLAVKDSLSGEEKKVLNKTLQILENDSRNESKENESSLRILLFILLACLVAFVSFVFYFQKKRKKEKLFYQNYIKTLEEKNLQVKMEEEKVIKKTNSSMEITEETEKQIVTKLDKFENSARYLNPNLSLSSLASDLKTNTRYLSEIISRHKGKNFNTYVNDLRIEYICKSILEDPKFRKYKISALASISGFSSAENFSKIFKKTTGISPSVFIENANNENKNTA